MTRLRCGPAARLLACVALAACGHVANPRPTPSPTGTGPTRPAPSPTGIPIALVGKARGHEPVRLTQLRPDGSVRYTLFADAIHAHYAGQDTGTSQLLNPHVTFVAAAGKRLSAVAPAGTLVEKDKTVRMNGGVRARSQDGMTLSSDTLRYDDQTQIVHGTGHVVVTFPRGERLTGDTVDWNLRTSDVEMNTKNQ